MDKRRSALEKTIVILMFLAMLIVGLLVFDDYGISVDEPAQRLHSIVNYRAVNRILFSREVFTDLQSPANVGSIDDINTYRHRFSGVAMQLPLVFAEDLYQHYTGNEMGYRQIYLMRHLYTFLVYYAALICFYFLLKRLFSSRWLAILGVLMVFLFGRMFAHSFYNIKDPLFVAFSIISLYCMLRAFDGRKPLWCLLFALSGALLTNIRIVGALFIVLMLLFFLAQDLFAARRAHRAGTARERRSFFKVALPYLLVCCAYPMWIILTPAAWSDPIQHTLERLGNFSDLTGGQVLTGSISYAGRLIALNAGAHFPRTYFMTWIALTAPVVVQLLCLLGIIVFVAGDLLKKEDVRLHASARFLLYMMLAIMAGTILYQFACQPLVNDGWRHAFYLYPMMAAFAVYGVRWLWSRARQLWLRIGIVCLLLGTLGYNAYRIASNHPDEYALFNPIGRNYAIGFDRDYWELSYSDLFQWLLANREGELRYYCGGTLDGLRVYMLKADSERLQFYPIEEADYVMMVFHEPNTNDFPIDGFTEIHAVMVDKVKLGAVYERNDRMAND